MSGTDKRGREQAIGGIVLILIGALFLMDRVWFLDLGRMIGRNWPLILIGIGIVQLLNGRARSWVGPIVLIVVGAVFQVQRIDFFDRLGWNLSWHKLWPVMLIGIGVALLVDRLRKVDNRAPAAAPPLNPAGGDSPQQFPQA